MKETQMLFAASHKSEQSTRRKKGVNSRSRDSSSGSAPVERSNCMQSIPINAVLVFHTYHYQLR